jgi:hypothetical protein
MSQGAQSTPGFEPGIGDRRALGALFVIPCACMADDTGLVR